MVSKDVTLDEDSFPCKEKTNSDLSTFPDVAASPVLIDLSPTPLDPPDDPDIKQVVGQVPENPHEELGNEPEGEQGNEGDHNQVEEHHEETQQNLEGYQLARDRTRREEFRRPPRYAYADLVLSALVGAQDLKEESEPQTYLESMTLRKREKWQTAIKDEINSLKVNKTWDLVPLPKSHKIVECRWIFTLKEGLIKEEPLRYKARLVAKGYTQREGIDFTEIFSPVVKFKTIRLMLSLAACLDLEVEQQDVKTTFLHGDLDEKIFMRQPEGYVDQKYPEHVYFLKRFLYGLKQSPRLWY
ncbi:unnamed protein product [Rhodiola kirilowii]